MAFTFWTHSCFNHQMLFKFSIIGNHLTIMHVIINVNLPTLLIPQGEELRGGLYWIIYSLKLIHIRFIRYTPNTMYLEFILIYVQACIMKICGCVKHSFDLCF